MNFRTWPVSFLIFVGACTAVDDMHPADEVIPGLHDPVNLLHQDPCIDIQVTHVLKASVYLPPRTVAAPESDKAGMIAIVAPGFLFEGNGDAFSDALARGRTEFRFAYAPSTQKLSGFVTTHFFFGEILEMEVDDVALVRYDEQTIFITVDLNDGSLETPGGTRQLVSGEITLEVPGDRFGTFPLTVSSSAMLCLK